MERNEAIEVVRKNWPDGRHQLSEALETLIPELKESEDEIIRNRIIGYLKQDIEEHPERKERIEDMLAWLENQGSQNLANSAKTCKVEPKFKVGDIIADIYCTGKVIELTSDSYLLDTGQGIPFSCEHNTHLWTIQDAKVGDVLYSKKGRGVETIDLVSGWKKVDGENSLCSACTYRIEDDEILTGGLGAIWWDGVQDPFYPATKEQRDLLFQKMKEAGYEWNAEKKELRKIEQNPAWSEEDREMRMKVLKYLSTRCNVFEYEEVEKWLDVIKGRYTWKPSEEQMKQLGLVVELNKDTLIGEGLMTLFNDLKKLKG